MKTDIEEFIRGLYEEWHFTKVKKILKKGKSEYHKNDTHMGEQWRKTKE